MNTVHVVTCGTSLLGNPVFQARCGQKIVNDPAAELGQYLALGTLDANSTDAIAKWWSSPGLREVRDALNTQTWPQDALLSAEMTSLSADPYRWKEGNYVIFLATDTIDNVGIAAAALVAEMFKSATNLRDPVTMLADPREFQKLRRLPGLCVVRQPSLDATRHEEFRYGMNSVALTLSHLFTYSIERWVVHLSGGFKAAIPTLISVLQFIASRQEVEIKVQICFEPGSKTSPTALAGAPVAHAISIPLLSFEKEDIDFAVTNPERSRFTTVLLDQSGERSIVWDSLNTIWQRPTRPEPEGNLY